MNRKIYLLAIISFIVGMVELIISGLLDTIALDLGISLSKVGLLITAFSLSFALFGPVLMVATQKIDRKKLLQWSLIVFFIGNLIAVVSYSYIFLLLARVIAAASGSLLIALSLTIASAVVEERYRARALGIVFMGISASLVLGVPIGLFIGNLFTWRAPFILICILSLLLYVLVWRQFGNVAPTPVISIKEQLKTLKNIKILFAQAVSFFHLTGHLVLYSYLTPYLKTMFGLEASVISWIYLLFGIAAVFGGGIGGTLTDKFGAKKTLISILTLFSLVLFSIFLIGDHFILFLIILIVWSSLSWASSPAVQTYLIEISGPTAGIQQTINNSFGHFGIALGAFIGGKIIEFTSIEYVPIAGSLILIFALISIGISLRSKKIYEIKEG